MDSTPDKLIQVKRNKMSIKITPKMFAMLDSNAQSAINGLFLAKPQAEVKAKRVLSPEHLAKLKAGRELAKLKKALKTEEPVAAVAAVVAEQPVATEEQKKRGPKPLSTKTPEELAAHKTKVAERKAEREAKKLAEPVAAPEPVAVAEPEPVVVAKAKRTLSPEHLAKLKAGRELNKLLQLAAAEMEKDLPPAPVAEPEVAPEPVVVAKAKRTLSPEHLAKLKAGREAAKAKKLASTEVTVTVTSPEVPRPSIEIPEESIMPEEPVPVAVAVAEPVLPEQPVEKKRRGPKKLSDMTPEELAAHKLKVEERKAAKVTFKEPVAEVEPVQIKFKTA